MISTSYTRPQQQRPQQQRPQQQRLRFGYDNLKKKTTSIRPDFKTIHNQYQQHQQHQQQQQQQQKRWSKPLVFGLEVRKPIKKIKLDIGMKTFMSILILFFLSLGLSIGIISLLSLNFMIGMFIIIILIFLILLSYFYGSNITAFFQKRSMLNFEYKLNNGVQRTLLQRK